MNKSDYITGPLQDAVLAAYDTVDHLEYDEGAGVLTIRYVGRTWWRIRCGVSSNGSIAAAVFDALAQNLWED